MVDLTSVLLKEWQGRVHRLLKTVVSYPISLKVEATCQFPESQAKGMRRTYAGGFILHLNRSFLFNT